jgi:hypothetical protein
MGFFSRLTNLAKGTWHAKTSSKGSGLTETELETELQTVRPPPEKTHPVENSPTKHGTPETPVVPHSEPAERDAEGNLIKTL